MNYDERNDALAKLFDPEPRTLVDPTNRHLVSSTGAKVIVGGFMPRQLTREQACELAAWLVTMADIAGGADFDAEMFFARAMHEIRNT